MTDKYASPEDTAVCHTSKCGHTAKLHKPYNAQSSITDKCYSMKCSCKRFVAEPVASKKDQKPKIPPPDDGIPASKTKPERLVRMVSRGRVA